MSGEVEEVEGVAIPTGHRQCERRQSWQEDNAAFTAGDFHLDQTGCSHFPEGATSCALRYAKTLCKFGRDTQFAVAEATLVMKEKAECDG